MADATWAGGEPYEAYVGRWSRLIAREFVPWLDLAPGARVLDVGCGTGALTEVLSASGADPTGVDPSHGFLEIAHDRLPGIRFGLADAQHLPQEDDSFDAWVAGLVYNFVPDRAVALREARRVVRSGGVVAAYVWDYADGMQLMRRFWDAAAEVDPAVPDEGERYAFCTPGDLAAEFGAAGLTSVATTAFVVPTVFPDFDAYWAPFLGGTGVAPVYLASLDEERAQRIRSLLDSQLPRRADGSIALTARAWAIKGVTV